MNTLHPSERGQIVVIFVVALVALLALTALAIDGGMLLSERRIAQGAADAASLAGTGAASRELQSGGVI
ncbi:MAG TPA: pilus assembly protein TadG-related protein, partial [Anaerolineaceae bacterium]|nr:pilus assembly protein TadG-related protein [Anaerolineaceae bacterium]